MRADEPAPPEGRAIDLWQLHRIDPKVPRDEQFGVIADMQKEGLIRHVGLSEVSVEEIEAAQKVFPVATVQNLYNLADRGSEAVLDHCEAQNIGFIPWFPLAAGDLAKPGSTLDAIVRKTQRDAEPGRARLGAEAQPGDAADPRHRQGRSLEDNVAAAGIDLSDEDFTALDAQAREAAQPQPKAAAMTPSAASTRRPAGARSALLEQPAADAGGDRRLDHADRAHRPGRRQGQRREPAGRGRRAEEPRAQRRPPGPRHRLQRRRPPDRQRRQQHRRLDRLGDADRGRAGIDRVMRLQRQARLAIGVQRHGEGRARGQAQERAQARALHAGRAWARTGSPGPPS